MSDSSIGDYLRDISRIPVLTKEAQLRHCRRIHRWVHWPEGRDAAPPHVAKPGRRSMDVMLQSNLRLVVSIAKKYQNRGLELADLIQEGSLGLVRGLELFDPTRGYALSTYSFWWIRQSITRALYVYARPIRLPINAYELLHKAQRLQAEHTSRTGEALTTPELAIALDVPLHRLETVLELNATTRCGTLDITPSALDSDHKLVDIIPDTRRNTADDCVDLPSLLQSLTSSARATLLYERLTHEERHVLQRLYFDDARTTEVARELELSAPRIRQIATKACRRLQLALRSPCSPAFPPNF